MGGPEVLTRREILSLIGEAARPDAWLRPRLVPLPDVLVRAGAMVLGPLHPRLSGLTRFFMAASSQDLVAPALGVRRLGSYLGVRSR